MILSSKSSGKNLAILKIMDLNMYIHTYIFQSAVIYNFKLKLKKIY